MASPNDFLDVQNLPTTNSSNNNSTTTNNNDNDEIETRISIPSLQGRLAAPQPPEELSERAEDPTGNGSRRASISKSKSSLRSRISVRPNDPLGVKGSGSIYSGNVEEAASQWRTRLLHEKFLDGSAMIPKSPRKVSVATFSLRSQQRLKQWKGEANGNPSEMVVEEQSVLDEQDTTPGQNVPLTAGYWVNPVVDTSQVDPYLQVPQEKYECVQRILL